MSLLSTIVLLLATLMVGIGIGVVFEYHFWLYEEVAEAYRVLRVYLLIILAMFFDWLHDLRRWLARFPYRFLFIRLMYLAIAAGILLLVLLAVRQ